VLSEYQERWLDELPDEDWHLCDEMRQAGYEPELWHYDLSVFPEKVAKVYSHSRDGGHLIACASGEWIAVRYTTDARRGCYVRTRSLKAALDALQ
jgi:hypothetical protein